MPKQGPPATTWSEPQIGNFGAQTKVNIPINGRLDIIATSSAAVGRTLALNLRLGGSQSGFPADPGTTPSFDGRHFSSVQLNAVDGGVFWALVSQDSPPTWGGSSRPGQFGASPPSILDQGFLAPKSLANGTAEQVEVAGAVAVPQGTRVYFVLNMDVNIVTAADVVTFVALKGHTSGKRFAVALAGQSVAGTFRTPNAASENIDIVDANADTVPHGVSAAYVAVAGE